VALAATVARRPRLAVVGATWWTIATARFAWRRIAPGPRDRREVARMLVTSLLIPPAAVWWAVRGRVRARRLAPRGPADRRAAAPPALVLFDRDGTLVVDVPYNGDPERVRPVPTAHAAVGRLRRAGVAVGIVTNQSGVARGEITPDQVDAVNRRVELLLGPFHTVQVCLHGPADGCRCRKPRAGMVEAAAAALAVDTARCAVVGDIGADIEAALAAGARAILVPTPATRRVEVDQAPEVAADLHAAVDLLLHHPPGRPRRDGAIPTTIPIITEVPS
jgi:histidinol-phosphate phosphatase family protein